MNRQTKHFSGKYTKTEHGALQQLGLEILAARLERGLTREALAGACDVDANYMWQIESGQRNPSFTVLAAIAAALDITLAELLRGAGL